MNVIQLNHPQGSPEWKLGRKDKFNASEAATMLSIPGANSTRQDLLAQFVMGTEKDISPALQSIFDLGHLFETLARPLAEQIIESEVPLADLYPVVLVCADDEELPIGASLDGRTMCKRITWEHKTLNQRIKASLSDGIIPREHKPQMEQGFMLSPTTEKCLFMATKWEESDEIEEGKIYGTALDDDGNERRYVLIEEMHAWYYPDKELQSQIFDGWKQFAEDAKNYRHIEVIPAAVATPQMGLPAVSIRVDGSIALVDNLNVFGDALTAYVERINKEPETDQDFADLEATEKTLKRAEEEIDAAVNSAIGQVSSFDTMKKTAEMYRKIARDNRLLVSNLVKARKETIKIGRIQKANETLQEHVSALQKRMGGAWMPSVAGNFQEAIKGLKTLTSIDKSIAGAIATAKIEANKIADLIEANRKSLISEDHDWLFLFPDFEWTCQKQADDFAAVLAMRIAKHKAAEEKHLEDEREKVRAEERALAEAKAKEEGARIRAEEQAKAKEEEARIRAEEQAKAAQEALNIAIEQQRIKEKLEEEERRVEARKAAVQSASAPPDVQAALIERQEDIAYFVNSRDWKGTASYIRGVLVEYEKSKIERHLSKNQEMKKAA